MPKKADPRGAYLFGATPVLRYQLDGLSWWAPFIDGGIGVTVTDIGLPDLSTTFQFNDQLGGGVRWVLRRGTELTLQYRFLHLSNGGIRQPNDGVNASLIFVGMSRFF